MRSFKSFLKESSDEVAYAKHQDHPEDNAIKSQHGFEHAVSTLHSVQKGLKTGSFEDSHVSTKLDGAPAIVFGHHPTTGKFFVTTKHGAFAKTPKFASSHAEIDQHFGHNPGLSQKMHNAFEHLSKVAPKKGMYQGDLMHDHGDLKHTDHEVSFKPNTITYHIGKDTSEGKKAVKSKVGIAVHTEIHGNPDQPETMKAAPIQDHSVFKPHADVHMISPETKIEKGAHLSKEEHAKVDEHIKKAQEIHNGLSSTHHDIIDQHADHLETYINKTVRTSEKPTTAGLREHIKTRMSNEIDKMKSEKGKANKTEALNNALAFHDTHEKSFAKALQIHHHIQSAKNLLIKGLNTANQKQSQMKQTIDGNGTDPEGYVVQHKNRVTKLVNRSEFAKANFLRPKEWQQK